MDSAAEHPTIPAPAIGGNTNEILKELGYSDETIAALRSSHTIK